MSARKKAKPVSKKADNLMAKMLKGAGDALRIGKEAGLASFQIVARDVDDKPQGMVLVVGRGDRAADVLAALDELEPKWERRERDE